LRDAVEKENGAKYAPKVLISDDADAISNAAFKDVFGQDIQKIMLRKTTQSRWRRGY
jgi:hypothetical protein